MMSDMTRRRFKLKDLVVRRVDTVDMGANDGADIVLVKSRSYQPQNEQTRSNNDMNPYEGYNKEDLEALVAEAASQLLNEGFDGTVEDARASIWEGDDGTIYNAYRNAISGGQIQKSYIPTRPETLREFGYRALKGRSEVLALQKNNWNLTPEQIFGELLESEAGEKVYNALCAGPFATSPASETLGQITKRASGWNQLTEAVEIAKRWIN